MIYDFSAQKNALLIEERGISFEEIILAISEGGLLDIIEHPNPDSYPTQKVYVVEIENYVYLVPFVENKDGTLFLKTVFPSRKFTKKYGMRGK